MLIDALRGRQPALDRVRLELAATSRLATTVITAFELLSGARSDRERAKVITLLDALDILPLTPAAAEDAAAIRRQLESRGEGIGTADTLIAGICRTAGAILMTFNRKHFERVANLALSQLERTRA